MDSSSIEHTRTRALLCLSIIFGGPALTVAASAEAQDSPPREIEEVVIYGRAHEFYRVQNSSFATKTPTDIMDIPQSVQVLTNQLMADQAARDAQDLYRSISGVTFYSYSGVTFRGFRQDEIRYDGVRGDPFAGFSVPQLFDVERVEVLKGVSGMLYGAGEPGGLINYVTKKPEFSRSGSVSITTGNRSLYGLSAEHTGPVADSDSLAYRVSGFYEEEDSFRRNASSETQTLNTALTWQPGDNTEITAQLGYYDITLPGNRLRGVPVDDDGKFITGIDWNTNEKSDFLALDALITQFNVKHSFNQDFSANITLRHVDNEEEQRYHESRGPAAPGSSLDLREFRYQVRDNEALSLTADFVLTKNWAGLDHTILFGVDTYKEESKFRERVARQHNPLNPAASLGPVQPLDFFNPVYGQSGYDILHDYLATIPWRRTASEMQRHGFYLQDQVTLNDQWQLIGGLRFDDYKDEDVFNGRSTSNDAISLRGGVIYRPMDTLSAYLSYGEGFLPQGVVDDNDGGPFDPQESDQIELGIKAQLLDGRILACASTYRIIKDGVLITNSDPNAGLPGVPRLLQVGEVTSKGFELDLVGDITDRWTFQANYAYNDTKITGGPPGSFGLAVGDRFPNAPKHAVGLWTRYEIDFLNSAIAGGIDYVDDRISIDNQKVPAYTTVDVSWITTLDAWKLQLNVRNLFDKEYAVSGFTRRNGHFPGEPRTVVAQASFLF